MSKTPSALSGTSPKYDIGIWVGIKTSPVGFGGGRWRLDFIINYDVKVRMGVSAGEEDE